VGFEETWTILYEAFVSRNEVGVEAAGYEAAFASGYTIVDNGADQQGSIAYLQRIHEIRRQQK
jgi:hypothetical protein